MSADDNNENPDAPQEVEFHYIKSNDFRIIHADGAHGGITPNGKIHIAFYNERNPIPKKIVRRFEKFGESPEEVPEKRVSKEGVVRETEVGVMMDVETAAQLAKWLGDQIGEHQELTERIQELAEEDEDGEE